MLLWGPTNAGGWVVSGGILGRGKLVQCASIKKECASIKKDYRRWTLAAVLYAWMEQQSGEPLPFEYSADDLIMCIVAALTEEVGENRRRRFAVYESISGLLGYQKKTQLPPSLEYAVEAEFPDVDFRYFSSSTSYSILSPLLWSGICGDW
ncbi:hypothetical protein R1sor_015436 [Riccia sorocarpa]|uniref:Uncharacterized protein n=1 Tax=Riccia sorocarpa TaxID=122646 RepID=A0ABD3HF86_9MARC